jgi:hypothetical protein
MKQVCWGRMLRFARRVRISEKRVGEGLAMRCWKEKIVRSGVKRWISGRRKARVSCWALERMPRWRPARWRRERAGSAPSIQQAGFQREWSSSTRGSVLVDGGRFRRFRQRSRRSISGWGVLAVAWWFLTAWWRAVLGLVRRVSGISTVREERHFP